MKGVITIAITDPTAMRTPPMKADAAPATSPTGSMAAVFRFGMRKISRPSVGVINATMSQNDGRPSPNTVTPRNSAESGMPTMNAIVTIRSMPNRSTNRPLISAPTPNPAATIPNTSGNSESRS